MPWAGVLVLVVVVVVVFHSGWRDGMYDWYALYDGEELVSYSSQMINLSDEDEEEL